jgi:hypothetical protein
MSYNFSFPYNYRPVDTGTTPLFYARIKADQYDSDTWYITYQFSNTGSCNRKFAETDQSFTVLDTDCISAFGGWEFIVSDCGISDGLAGDERFVCIGSSAEHSSFWYGSSGYWYQGNQSYVEKDNCVDETKRFSGVLAVMDDSVVEVWRRGGSSDVDPRYTQNNDICGGGDFDGDGSINYPTIYESPTDLQLASCGGAYHHIIRKGSSIYDLIFDYSHNYKTAYSLTYTGWHYNTYDYGVWADDNVLYFVAVNDTGGADDSGLINIQAWECSGYSLNYIYSEILSQNEINSTANYTANRYMRMPYITRDDQDRYNLFYMWYDNGSYSIDVAVEERLCINGSWIPSDICVDGYRKYTRNVIPEGCTNSTKWEYDASCYGEFCTPTWVCIDEDTKAYKNLDCSLSTYTDCIGGTPYCSDGVCVAGCTRGYACIDGVTQAFVDELCQQSEIVNCNSTGYGYCYGGRCYEETRPAFEEDASVLDVIETATAGVLRWLSPPLFKILMAIGVTLLILGVLGLIVAVAKKVGR